MDDGVQEPEDEDFEVPPCKYECEYSSGSRWLWIGGEKAPVQAPRERRFRRDDGGCAPAAGVICPLPVLALATSWVSGFLTVGFGFLLQIWTTRQTCSKCGRGWGPRALSAFEVGMGGVERDESEAKVFLQLWLW